jgi:thymidylate synthase (FAD)
MKVLDKGSIELLAWLGNDNTIVSAARVSYLGESKGTDKDTELLRYLMENNHTSPFEQVEFQFRVKCPLFVAREWMRHRTWSYNEISRRYTSKDIEFHIPSVLRAQSKTNKQSSEYSENINQELIGNIEKNSIDSYNLYKLLINKGVCREQARMVLPVNMYTSFYAKTDLHNLFHFLELRTDSKAQAEIRLYAFAIELLIEPIVPISFKLWKETRK